MRRQWPLSILEWVGRAVLRLAPPAFRDGFGADLHVTYGEVCRHAYRRRGLRGAFGEGLSELVDLARTALRARLGGQAPLGPPSPRARDRSFSTRHRLARDVRLGLRSLRAGRTHTVLAVATLALGLGLMASAFSVLDSLILRPMPFDQADRFVEIWAEQDGLRLSRHSRAQILEWRDQTDLFDQVEAYESEAVVWRSQRGAEMVSAGYLTPGLLALLGVPPVDGRLFAPGDGRDGSDALVVVSERFWRSGMGVVGEAVGSVLTINERPHTVIGVMPASFRFPLAAQDLWLPLDLDQPPASRMQGRLAMTIFARVQSGVTPAQLTEQVEARGQAITEATGGRPGFAARPRFQGEYVDSPLQRSLLVLGGAAAFLLLIVCANVANLSLSRTLGRSRDFAMRAAFGASRWDLIRETLVENALVGAVGVVLGLLVARLTLALAVATLPASMFVTSLNEVNLDGRAVAVAMIVGLGTILLFGLPPALIASRPNVANTLRFETRATTGSRAARRLRAGLVVTEVAISIVLLVGAALMARSFLKLQAVDRGFDSSALVALRVGLPSGPYSDPRQQDRFSDELIDELRGIPGVAQATADGIPPDASRISIGGLEFAHTSETVDQAIVPVYEVWPDYFETTGIPLLAGRPFAPDESGESVIISRSLAERFWADQSPLGGRFRFSGASSWFTVIGVAGEVRQLGLDDAMGAFEWFMPLRVPPGAPPYDPSSARAVDAIADYRTFVVRADRPAAVLDRVRQAVHAIDDRVVIWEVATVDANFIDAVARPRVLMFMLSVFASLALVLAAVGIYGVLSYVVVLRLREIGIRLAIGGHPGRIFRLVLASGLRLTLAGVAIGTVLALALVRVMRTLLYDVEPTDPISVGVVLLLLVGTALIASWRPATRAMRVDPIALLREP